MIVADGKTIDTLPVSTDNGSTIPIEAAKSIQRPSIAGMHQAKDNKVFTKDSSNIPESLKSHFERYIQDKDDFAVVTKDNNGNESLVIALTGPSLYKNAFYDPWYYKPIRWIKTFFSWIFRFKPKSYNYGLNKFKELFVPNSKNQLQYRGESPSHLIKNLKSGGVSESGNKRGHYYGQILFQKDPQTGKFKEDPETIIITDSNLYAARHEASNFGLSKDQIKKHDGYYMIDKVLPFNSDHNQFTPNLIKIIDSLLLAKPDWYKAFEVGFKINDEYMSELKESHEVEPISPWHVSLMKADGSFENQSSYLNLIGPKGSKLNIPPKLPEIISRIMTSSGAADLATKYKDEVQKTIKQNYETLNNNPKFRAAA